MDGESRWARGAAHPMGHIGCRHMASGRPSAACGRFLRLPRARRGRCLPRRFARWPRRSNDQPAIRARSLNSQADADRLEGGRGRILSWGTASKSGRVNGTIHMSYDEGATWPVGRQLVAGRFAYSVLARLSDGRVACLFETGNDDPYERIRIARFPISWLTEWQPE